MNQFVLQRRYPHQTQLGIARSNFCSDTHMKLFPLELQLNWDTQKAQKIHIHECSVRGTASAPFVPAQGIRAQENSLSPHPRPLSTAVLARTTGKLLKHHASASAKSRDVFGTGNLTLLS